MYSIDQLIRFKLILLLHRMSALILKGIAYSGSCQPTGWIAHHYCRSTSLVYIRHANLILVIEDGGIVESGTYEQLLANHGYYWKMNQIQNTV